MAAVLVAEAVEEDSLADSLEAVFPAVVVRAVPGDWGAFPGFYLRPLLLM